MEYELMMINVNVTVDALEDDDSSFTRPEIKFVFPVLDVQLEAYPDLTQWRLAAYIGKLFGIGNAKRITFEYSLYGKEYSQTWRWKGWDCPDPTDEDDTPQISHSIYYGQNKCEVCIEMHDYIKEEVYVKLTTLTGTLEEDEVEDDLPRCSECNREW